MIKKKKPKEQYAKMTVYKKKYRYFFFDIGSVQIKYFYFCVP